MTMKSQLKLRQKASLQDPSDGNLLQMRESFSNSKPDKDDFDDVQSCHDDIIPVNHTEPISAIDEGPEVTDGLQAVADDTITSPINKDLSTTNDETTKADEVINEEFTSYNQTSFSDVVPDSGISPQRQEKGSFKWFRATYKKFSTLV